MLKLEKVSIFRGKLCVANQIDLTLENGKVYALLGANGAGKSSLIKALFGEIHHSGHIHYFENKLNTHYLSAWRKKIAYMPQDTVLDASLSALEVVLLGQLDNLNLHISDEQLKVAIEMMNRLGIVHLAQQDVLSLSGGQRQMVMFAQVLLRNPEILLLDEPVSALDMHHQCVLLEQVRQETAEKQLITLMILHDLNLASQFADELIFLGEGQIQAKGRPKSALQQNLIEDLYRVKTHLFHHEYLNIPFIVPHQAV